MSDYHESLQQRVEYYEKSTKHNKLSAHLSTVIAIGFGGIAGAGVSLIIDGQPIGALASGAGGFLSWQFAKLSRVESDWAKEDAQKLANYQNQLSEVYPSTEDLE